MKKVNIICKIIIALMLLFCLSYTILFLCAKYGSKIDIENSNSIYMYDKDKKSFYETYKILLQPKKECVQTENQYRYF